MDIRSLIYQHYCFTKEENALLFANCPVIRKNKHEYLYKPDDIVQRVYLIQKGEVKIYLPRSNGSNKTITYQREGCMVGLVSSFSNFPSAWYCEAIKPSEFLSCPIDVFWKRLLKYDLAFKYTSLEAKKLYFLNIRNAIEDIHEFSKHLIEEGFTHQEIADIIGYSRIQVSRICSQLKKDGFVGKKIKEKAR